MKKIVAVLGISLAFTVWQPLSAEPQIQVVATIKPIHSMVAAVLDGIAQPSLIVKGNNSAHGYQLRPSEAQQFEQADIVVWVGPALESTMSNAIANLPKNAAILQLSEVSGLTLYENRESPDAHDDHDSHEAQGHREKDDDDHEHAGEGHDEDDEHEGHGHDGHDKDDESHEMHEHEEKDDDHHEDDHDDHGDDHDDHGDGHDGHGHAHGGVDIHVWLDVQNAKKMASAVAALVAQRYPQYEAQLHANLNDFSARIDALETDLQHQMAPIVNKPFIVFHDAYQYLEKRFDLRNVGAIAVNPEITPGVRKISELKEIIRETGATCAFAEPQFSADILDSVTEGAQIQVGVLDPLGADIVPGPDAYFELMRNLANALSDCLG